MCGFLGKVSFGDCNHDNLIDQNELITCRGPDSKKILSNQNNDDILYTFIFNRLSILDLSEKADQPMVSKEFNSIVMFNGEIYNHKELRKDLEKKKIRFYANHSDTEVILNGLSYYGLDFVKRLRGQFSISFLDKKNRKIYLIRDRIGQKPLYYYSDKTSLIFGSNLLSLIKSIDKAFLDEGQIYQYLNYGMTSSPNTIFKGFFKVLPSEIIEINYSKDEFNINKRKYWNIEEKVDEKKFNEEEFCYFR